MVYFWSFQFIPSFEHFTQSTVALISTVSFCRNGLTVDSKKMSFAEMMTDDAQTSREERCFRLWINSLGTATYVNNVFEDVRNGSVLILSSSFPMLPEHIRVLNVELIGVCHLCMQMGPFGSS